MDNNTTTNGARADEHISTIRERLARYSSQRLSSTQHSDVLEQLREAVLAATPRHVNEAMAWMTILAGFVSDVAAPGPCELSEILNDAAVSRWVSSSIQKGVSRHTLATRRAVLIRILAAMRGSSQDLTLRARPTLRTAISSQDVDDLLTGCLADSRSALRGAVAHLLAGVPVGSSGARFSSSEGQLVVATRTRNHAAAPSILTLLDLEDAILTDEDWIALKDVAASQGISLSPTTAIHIWRTVALGDTTLSLSQRIPRYWLSEEGVTAILSSTTRPSDAEFLGARELLRSGAPQFVCTDSTSPAPLVAPRGRGTKGAGHEMTRKTSRAAAKRLAAQRMVESAALAATAQPVVEYLATYVPDIDDEVWEKMASDVRSAVAACEFQTIETARKHAVALTAFLRWRASLGYSFEVGRALTFSAIDEFFARGMSDLAARSRRDYRSRLRLLAQRANPSAGAPPSLQLGHNQVNPGYSLDEERAIRRAAFAQDQSEVRRRLCAIVGLCAGAGVSSQELRELRRRNVIIHDDGAIEIGVQGARPRRTVVRQTYERLVLVALEGLEPEQPVLPELKSSSPITVILKGADLYGDLPNIDTRRLRTTWISWLMDQRIPLAVAVEASGLRSSRTFWDILSRRAANGDLSALREGSDQ